MSVRSSFTEGLMFRSCQAILVLIALLITSVRAEEPRASVPILKVGDPAQTSFLVEGFIANDEKRGFAFRIATDGKQHLFTLADAADGVPFFISNGDESLIYDLAQEQILFVPESCFGFHLRFDRTEETFAFKLTAVTDKAEDKRRECLPKIDFQHLPEIATERDKSVSKTGMITYEIKQASKKRDRLVLHPEQRDWFCYSDYNPDSEEPVVLVKATCINQKIPGALLRFPDSQKFSEKISWNEDLVTKNANLNEFLKKQRFWMTKMMVAMGAEDNENWKILLPNISSDELLERDKKLGAIYLQELKAQQFEPLKKPADFAKQPR